MDYIINYGDREKPTLDRMIDIVLEDEEIGSDQLEQISDAIFDLAGWLERCTDALNARTRVRRAEEEARGRGAGSP